MSAATTGMFDPAWLATATDGHWLQIPEQAVTGVSHDTRTLRPGDLYVAIRGARVDGHALLAAALQAGAVAALVDTTYTESADRIMDVPLLVVPATIPALGRMAAMHRHRTGAWITGVTGSMGKTTVKDLTAALLQQAGPTVATRGNWNNEIGLPLSLLRLQPDTLHGVFEIGMNHPGELDVLSDILSPDWGIITAIGPVHIEHFASVDAIAEEKAAMLRALPPSGLALLPYDDPYYPVLAAAADCSTRTVSLQTEDADLLVRTGEGILHVQERDTRDSISLRWGLPGTHHAWNAGLALLAARATGLDWDAIQAGLDAYQPAPMRWQEQTIEGIRIINDAYNANPPSMRAALETFAAMSTRGRKWLVLGDMLELGDYAEEAHAEMGRLAGTCGAAGLIVLGAFQDVVLAATRAQTASGQMVLCGARDKQEACAWVRQHVASGDAVLLKASRAMQLEQIIEQVSLKRKEEEPCKQV